MATVIGPAVVKYNDGEHGTLQCIWLQMSLTSMNAQVSPPQFGPESGRPMKIKCPWALGANPSLEN